MSNLITRAIEILNSCGVVALPTETVYGLAANALDAKACNRIFEIKGRPLTDPLIIHLKAISELEKYAEIPDHLDIKKLIQFWPGPLTAVLPKKKIIPDSITAGLATAAFRVPAHPIMQEVLQQLDFPLAAPSANPFGYLSPTQAKHVEEMLGDRVDLILDGGPCTVGVESTIVDFTQKPFKLLRPGGIPLEELEKVFGTIERASKKVDVKTAPGLLDSHYAPHTPLLLQDPVSLSPIPPKTGLICFEKPKNADQFEVVAILGKNLEIAANQLFATLHDFDHKGLSLIVAEPPPATGMGLAILDRLTRASHKRVGK